MLRSRGTLRLAVLLAAAFALPVTVSLAQVPPSKAAASNKPKSLSKKSAPVAEVPQLAPVPPTLEEQPPVAPQVTYHGGQLTIDSTNATLSQVLHSVQTQTGASVDMPPGAGGERVVATLGPGTPKDVLASLLNGSKFNYVILGEPDHPGAVQKVILLAKSGSAGDASTTAQNNLRGQPQQQAVDPSEDEPPQPDPEAENLNQPVPGQPGAPGSEQLAPEAPGAAPGPRTPDQMLQELQRIQQQQQQMQQQLNPANQPPVQSSPFPGQPLPPRPQ
jgi:hypothetical protein